MRCECAGYVPVCVENQFAAVAMALPFGDYFHVNAPLDCASDEHSAERAVTVGRQLQSLARCAIAFLAFLIVNT